MNQILAIAVGYWGNKGNKKENKKRTLRITLRGL